MGRSLARDLPHYLRDLLGVASGRNDRELLQAFAAARDEAAFAAVMQRHGPLVWGVCRRLLRDEHAAEDAFQATFFVLARRAGSVAWRDDAGGWLYAVALRVAGKLRARQRKQPQIVSEIEAPAPAPAAPDHETAALVAEEVGRLPEKYRLPMILCGLQGKSYGEAARLLGWPEGTVSGRLARGREMLRQRLQRRGYGPEAMSPAALAVPLALPAGVAETALRDALTFAAGAALKSPAADLAREVLRAMWMSKIKAFAGAFVVVAVLGAGLGLFALTRQVPAAPAPSQNPEPPPRSEARFWSAPKARTFGKLTMYHHVLAFSPDGGEMVIEYGRNVYVYDLTRGKIVRQFSTNESVHGADVSPDGKLIATAEWREGTRIRDFRTFKVLDTIANAPMGAWYVRFSPDGKRLTGFDSNQAGGPTKLQLWVYDVAEKKVSRRWPAYAQPDKHLSYIRDRFVGSRPLLLSVEQMYDGNKGLNEGYRIWLTDPETNKKTKPLTLGKLDYFQFDVSSDGEKAVVMEVGEPARLIETKTGKTLRMLDGHKRWLRAAAFSPRGQLVATATGTRDDGHALCYTQKRSPLDAPTEIIVRSVATGKVVAKWENEKKLDFYHIGFAPNGRYLWAMTGDYELWLWGGLPEMPDKMEPIPVKLEKKKQ